MVTLSLLICESNFTPNLWTEENWTDLVVWLRSGVSLGEKNSYLNESLMHMRHKKFRLSLKFISCTPLQLSQNKNTPEIFPLTKEEKTKT